MIVPEWNENPTPELSILAEKALLGALMILGKAATCPPGLRPEDFESNAHRLIFQAALKLEADESSIDPVLVIIELDRVGRLVQAGGGSYVAGLLDMVPDLEAIPDYAKVVMEAAAMRRARRPFVVKVQVD